MKAQFKKSSDIEKTRPVVGRQEQPKITDMVEMLDWPKGGKSTTVRPVGPIAARGVHKIKVKKRDGSETEITKSCLAFDVASGERDTTKKCPYCKLPASMARYSTVYFINVISRELQEDKPNKLKPLTKEEKSTGFKSIDSDSWTPARVMRAPSSLALRFKQLGEKNLVKSKTGDKKAYPVTHEKYGFDLDVSFDKTLPAANMYSADRAENPDGGRYSPITEEENEILLWNTDPIYEPEDFATAKKEADSLRTRYLGEDADEDEDEDDDEDDRPAKKKSAAKGKSKSRDEDEDEDDEDEDLDLDDDDDEDEKPSKSKKPVKKTTKKSRDEDEDDEDDEDEDDADEDLDLDDEDEDDEDERPSKSKKPVKKAPAKKSRRDEDDEDEDDDSDDEDDEDEDDEDDEDERPAKKSSKKPVKKAPAKKSRDEDEDEEDEDEDDSDDLDDLDDDEDDEDEKPAKKPVKKPAASAKKPVKKTRR